MALFKEIRSAYKEKKSGYELFIKARLLEILYWISNQLSDENKADTAETIEVTQIKKSLAYINQYYQRSLTLKEIAEYIYISPGQYDRLFRKIIGITPFSYIVGYRIHKSSQMLAKTQKTITEIALETGFTNFSYFSKCFRDKMKMTPSEYRRNVKQHIN